MSDKSPWKPGLSVSQPTLFSLYFYLYSYTVTYTHTLYIYIYMLSIHTYVQYHRIRNIWKFWNRVQYIFTASAEDGSEGGGGDICYREGRISQISTYMFGVTTVALAYSVDWVGGEAGNPRGLWAGEELLACRWVGHSSGFHVIFKW
jgi:hypothetical protein